MGVVLLPIGDKEYLVEISDDSAGPTTEFVIDLPFRKGVVLRHKAFGSGGGVASIESYLSRSSNAPTANPLHVEFRAVPIGGDAFPALPTTIDEQPTWPVLFYAATRNEGLTSTAQGRLYYRPTPDVSGVQIVAEFTLREGWPPLRAS